MGNQKLNKKGSSIVGIFITIVIVFAVFSGLYLYLDYALDESGQTMEGKYQTAYENISDRHDAIDDKTQDIREAVTEIEESESTLDAGLTSIKGAYKALLLVPTVVTTGLGLAFDIIKPLEFLPAWAIASITAIIAIVLVFVVLKAILGRAEV